MKVLEKIKRCVSLVWDFQEIYGDEDIEDFCSNELRTYPQHDEIMEYFKHIEELEKENADLQKSHQDLYNSMRVIKDQRNKAKEIIKTFCGFCSVFNSTNGSFDNLIAEAEQFLKEIEKFEKEF